MARGFAWWAAIGPDTSITRVVGNVTSMPSTDLPHSTPSAEGVDAAGIEAFLDEIDDLPQISLHSVMVLRHGKVIAEGWWKPYSPERVHLLYSLSKSFTSTAAGFAVAEGLLDLDATVVSYFPELDAEITDPRSREMKVRHIAAMSSGHTAETLDLALEADPDDLVRGFLLTPPDRNPGTVFAYNQPCTYTLAAIIQRESGKTLVEYLRPRLLDPLGIGAFSWMEMPRGLNLGFTGLHATTDAVARLGQLYLDQGRWDDAQLLAPEWVAEATREHIDSPDEDNPDWRRGYGYQFWMSAHGYRGDGAYGQFCVIVPEADLVFVTTAQTEDMQGILDAVWQHLLPAVGRAPSDADSDDRLSHRLSHLSLPPVRAAAQPADRRVWEGATFLPGSGPRASAPVLGGLAIEITEATLRRVGDNWRLVLADQGGTLEVPVGVDDWTVDESAGVPVAASGGWAGDTFLAEVIFLETPHSVRITCSGPDRTVSTMWRTVPMRCPSLLELRQPRPIRRAAPKRTGR
jgi:CubicO group peptidase (beta-lactamase class C family)